MDELVSFGMIEGAAGGGTRIASNTWSLLMSSPPDWNRYIQSGPFRANLPTIQTINRLEFDERYIRLGTGELAPGLYPKRLMAEVFRRLPEKVASLGYLGPLGLPELRESLAKRLSTHGIPATKDNILITSGALQALQLISVCMLKAGSTVFTEAPTYLKSLQVFQSAGMNFRGVPMDRSGIKYWEIDKVGSGSLLYTIPTHHNPTGIVMSQERRKELFDFCAANRLPMIEDDAYGDLWFDGRPPSALKAMDKNGMILYLGTMSKTMAPGLRVGWVVGPESVTERLGDVKMQTDYGASSLSQWAAAELLESGLYDEYSGWLREELKSRRDHALAALDESFSDLARWDVPTGGFYIWLRFKDRIQTDKLFNRALENNILLNPGNVYDFSENHSLRLSFSYASPEDLTRSVKTLARIVPDCRT
jgi:GntR family transcriptional regulator, regulator for abcA and norABC